MEKKTIRANVFKMVTTYITFVGAGNVLCACNGSDIACACNGWDDPVDCSNGTGLCGLTDTNCSFFLREAVNLLCRLFFCSSKWPFLPRASCSCWGGGGPRTDGSPSNHALTPANVQPHNHTNTHLSTKVLIRTLEHFI